MSFKRWLLFLFPALISLFLWLRFEYPYLIFMDFSVNRHEAFALAEDYLKCRGVNALGYSKAIVFKADDWSDRYLQRVIGINGEEEFFRAHNFEMFFWQVRFFRQKQKEEYRVNISSRTGKVIEFEHHIEDTEARPQVNKEKARALAWEFLRSSFGLKSEVYDFHEENIKRYDNRIDYAFSWEKKGVYIPWKEHRGGAKLLTEVTVSGNEIRNFRKDRLDIPEHFKRYVEDQFTLGGLLYIAGFIVVVVMLAWSVFILVNRKDSPVIRAVSKWYYALAALYLIVYYCYEINNLQGILIYYPTSVALYSYLGYHLLRMFLNSVFISLSFVIPALAGEFICSQDSKAAYSSSLLHYLKSSFLNRGLAASVILGYLLFVIMAGMQAVIFYLGQRFCGVWKEWLRLTEFSSVYFPVFSAFAIGFSASVREELIFRLFGINISKKYLRRDWLAVIIISLIWGLGHSAYPIFPVWFRIIEITIIGTFLGFVYLRYGLVALLVAHYLFDVFLSTAPYLFGHSQPAAFFSSAIALLIPFFLALAAWLLNKPEEERDISLSLNRIQQYNLGVLEIFVASRTREGRSRESIRKELLDNNWDPVLVDLAIKAALEKNV